MKTGGGVLAAVAFAMQIDEKGNKSMRKIETHHVLPRCKKITLAGAVALATLLPAASRADDFFLRGSDTTSGTTIGSSLNGANGQYAGGWTNAVGTSYSSMTAGNSYYVIPEQDYYLIFSPRGVASWTAPEGASLTVSPNAELRLALKGVGNTTSTISFGDVHVGENSLLWVVPALDNTGYILNGNFLMSEGSELKLNNFASGNDIRQITLAATMSGKGTISSIPTDASATSVGRNTFITGDLSGFTGNLVTYSPDIVTGNNNLQLTGEKSIPADPAPGETASVVVTNGASILAGQDWISGTNRIWDLGSGRPPRVIVSPQKSVVIRGRATGSAGFGKYGDGVLVFDGETDISGPVTVAVGVVDVREPAKSMADSVTWSVSNGVAAVHFPDSVAMPAYYLKATDGPNQSSMSGTSGSGGWAETPGGSATKTAAVMKKRYVVDNGYVLRPPSAGNRDYAFGGNTLTVNNGAVVHTLNASANTSEYVLTIYDMRVPAGGVCKMQGVTGNKPYGWGGNYEIGEGALLSFYGVASQSNRIYANISGTGKLNFPVNPSANSKQDDYLYGDLSAFTGVIEAGATGSGTKPILAFATAKSFPGDTAAATEQGLSVANGVKLVFSASGSIGPNRGVFFGNGTRTVVDVAAGETVEISSDVSGTSGFEKTGAGTLVLTGNLKGLSGTVKVSEGTLSLPCESRCRTFTLDIAEGATVTHATPPGLMLFVR